ncbi:molybdenum cofactor guanylyltransferase [Mesobacillus foraminis]|uniref:molybdenum cofactor guanylyltransferase n=1 Tax=Mesobacillus foraminis TaxID=279826 RepID=UPI000EF46742|nr:molybdenum cofactor guanylyltransferase [Mesobacillus foraminis]
MKAGAIILSGGRSSRMGTNKAFLPLAEKANIERIRDELYSLFDHIILVTNELEKYEFLKLKMVEDEHPGKGPLAGIHAGLKASDYEENIIVACDMPFISAEIAGTLARNLKSYDAIVPVIGGRQHPLFAAYQKRIINQAESRLKQEELRLKDFLEALNVRYLWERDLKAYSDASLERVFFNMNQPEEYDKARKWIEAGD